MNKVQIFIDKKEVRIDVMRDHREEQEKLSREECKNIPIQSNRHNT